MAAICAGTSVLINAGANFIDQSLVISDNIATSRSPNDLPVFVLGIKKLLL
ncbi:MAG: hypothetical protein ACXVCE_13130 [Bacteriovorax sp.]